MSLRRCGLATWPGCLLRAGTFLTGRWSRSFGEEERPRFRRIADDVRAALDYAIECGDADAAGVLGGRFGRYVRRGPLAGGQRVGHACPEAAGRSA